MNRKAFYHLLKRYLEDDCTEEEKQLVEQWYELLGDDDGSVNASNTEIKDAIHRIWPAVQQQTISRPPRRLWYHWISAAAILAGLVIGVYWFTSKPGMHTTQAN